MDLLGVGLLGSHLLTLGKGLRLLGLVLLGNGLGLGGLSLLAVNVLDQNTLVLALVTLARDVEKVVDVLVDLLRLTVLAEETTENALAAHPQQLGGHTGLTGTASLTGTGVATLKNKKMKIKNKTR